MFQFRVISSILMYFCVFTMMCEPVPVLSAESPSMKDVLPIHECSDGWIMEDNVKLFTRDTLFDHINGEAELYFPYGFDILATAIYTNKTNPQSAILADVYRMGSLLDAFGIYSNYRKANSERASIGAEGFISPTQLMFYQDRYFIRLQASGQAIQLTETSDRIFMTAADPLYGNMVLEHSGRYVIGAVRVKDFSSAIKLLEQLRSRLVSYDNAYKP
jgi:hypothetical protein